MTSRILSVPWSEDDGKLSLKQEIRRLEKERREWKQLAEDRYIRMKKLSKQLALLKEEMNADSTTSS